MTFPFRLSPLIFHTVSDKNLTRGKAGYEASEWLPHERLESFTVSHLASDTTTLPTIVQYGPSGSTSKVI